MSAKGSNDKRASVPGAVTTAPPSYTIPLSFARTIADVPPSQHGCYEGTLSCIGNASLLPIACVHGQIWLILAFFD